VNLGGAMIAFGVVNVIVTSPSPARTAFDVTAPKPDPPPPPPAGARSEAA